MAETVHARVSAMEVGIALAPKQDKEPRSSGVRKRGELACCMAKGFTFARNILIGGILLHAKSVILVDFPCIEMRAEERDSRPAIRSTSNDWTVPAALHRHGWVFLCFLSRLAMHHNSVKNTCVNTCDEAETNQAAVPRLPRFRAAAIAGRFCRGCGFIGQLHDHLKI